MSNLSDFFRGIDGAASGAPVNTISTLNIPKDINLYTDPNGGEWIRNGYFITSSFASYPNAVTSSGIRQTNIISDSFLDLMADTGDTLRNKSEYFLRNNGTDLFIASYNITSPSADKLVHYQMTVPGDITTATYVRSGSVDLTNTSPNSINFSPDGLNIFYSYGSTFGKYTLSSAWDISTMSSFSSFASFSESSIAASISPDGNHIYYTTSTATIKRMALNSSFGTDVNTGDSETFSITGTHPVFINRNTGVNMDRVIVNSDGTELLLFISSTRFEVVSAVGNVTAILKYTMSTPHDLSTLTFDDYVELDYELNEPNMSFDSKYIVANSNGLSALGATTIISLDGSIGIPKSRNKNIFLKIK